MIRKAFTAAAATLALASATKAAIVTDIIDITTQGYSDVTGAQTPPLNSADVKLRVTFDPTKPITIDSNQGNLQDLTVVSIPPALDFGNYSFVYDPTNGAGFTSGTANSSFQVELTSLSQFNYSRYTLDNGNNIFVGAVGNVTTSPASAAPEPAAWTMLLLGVGGVGAAARARIAGRRTSEASLKR